MPERARWTCPPYSVAAADRIAQELELSPVTASILVRRGYDAPESAQRFLDASERHDPFLFAQMRDACQLILRHVERGSRIAVHGDYDVDGVCSTAILLGVLRALGANPRWHLPSRFDDGYGLRAETIERLGAQGTELLVTADCGITAAAEVDSALAAGIDVVITDHHRPGERLPACPTLHPALGAYPFEDLCAAGVTHKLAQALRLTSGIAADVDDELDLVALATICDVVPLRGENRRLVREGLVALGRTSRPGLRALMRVAQLDPAALDERAVGFRLGPRLNAAGRLRRADAALELLTTADDERAAEVAEELDQLNRERRDAETRILFAAEAMCAERADRAALVLAGEGWHSGVIGIVASRLTERHHRPCVVIALEDDGGRGSARSIPSFDLHAGLSACASHLRRFGGHRAAAGLELDRGLLEGFAAAFEEEAARRLTPQDLVPAQTIDAVASADALGLPVAEELRRLAPFGHGNPEPIVLVPAARASGVRAMGDEGQHARLTVSSGGASAQAVAFRMPPRAFQPAVADPHDVAVTVEVNEWRGSVEPRLTVRALCPTEGGGCRVLGEDAPLLQEVGRALEQEAGVRPRHEQVTDPGGVRDRRGAGLAGLAGDLLMSGESVLLVCADASRRREPLARLLAGLVPSGGHLELGEWGTVTARSGAIAGFSHALAIDPPMWSWSVHALTAPLPEDGLAVLGWGPAETQFALAVAEARLDLRPHVSEIYRALRGRDWIFGTQLEGVLRGSGSHPRPASVAGLALRILAEIDLVEVESAQEERLRCRVISTASTSLDRSAAYRASKDALEEARSFLAGERERLSSQRAA